MDVDENDWMREISRLTALAERLADERQMNLNKLVEAAIYAKVRQAGWRYRPQVTKISMQTELETAIRELREEGLSPELVAVLNGAGYNLLTDVLDLERDDVVKVPGMTQPLAEQLMAFLADLTAEESGEEGAAG